VPHGAAAAAGGTRPPRAPSRLCAPVRARGVAWLGTAAQPVRDLNDRGPDGTQWNAAVVGGKQGRATVDAPHREGRGRGGRYVNVHWEPVPQESLLPDTVPLLERFLVRAAYDRRPAGADVLERQVKWLLESGDGIDRPGTLVGCSDLGSRPLVLQAAALPFVLPSIAASDDRACLLSLELTRKVVESMVTAGSPAAVVQSLVQPDARGLTSLLVTAGSNTAVACVPRATVLLYMLSSTVHSCVIGS
jgi:hypothetical protein